MEFDSTYDERVAIMIHDGGLSEGEAQQKAWMICYRRGNNLVCPTESKKMASPIPEPPAAEQMSFEEFQRQARARFG
jgi:hypothetical protein